MLKWILTVITISMITASISTKINEIQKRIEEIDIWKHKKGKEISIINELNENSEPNYLYNFVYIPDFTNSFIKENENVEDKSKTSKT